MQHCEQRSARSFSLGGLTLGKASSLLASADWRSTSTQQLGGKHRAGTFSRFSSCSRFSRRAVSASASFAASTPLSSDARRLAMAASGVASDGGVSGSTRLRGVLLCRVALHRSCRRARRLSRRNDMAIIIWPHDRNRLAAEAPSGLKATRKFQGRPVSSS